MKLKELITSARTCRRFKGEKHLSSETLAELVDHARLSASARNMQVIRFITVADRENCERLNSLVVMGGALTPEQRATDRQHPGGFIVIAGPDKMDDFAMMDVGIAAQSINLAACEAGLACCMIGAVKKEEAAIVEPTFEETSSGGGTEELAKERTGYFTEVEIKEEKADE